MRRVRWLDWLRNGPDLLTTRVEDGNDERGEDEMRVQADEMLGSLERVRAGRGAVPARRTRGQAAKGGRHGSRMWATAQKHRLRGVRDSFTGSAHVLALQRANRSPKKPAFHGLPSLLHVLLLPLSETSE